MRRFTLTALAVGALALGPEMATAMPLGPTTPAADPNVMLVEGGCGYGLFRDYNGYCHPFRLYGPPPRPSYGCGWGWHGTPWGCRPNY